MKSIKQSNTFSLMLYTAGLALMSAYAFASPVAIPPVANPCPRLPSGSQVTNPPSLFSQNGVLAVSFSYQTRTDADGRALYCFMTPDGKENPTLHLKPGDKLVMTVTNNVPDSGSMSMSMAPNKVCGDGMMNSASVNVHYHGANISPACHQDDVVNTIINSGQTFQYDINFPNNEPAGLYWYHPHIHGNAENAVLGGASGAIVVDGLESMQPLVAGMSERILLIRDQVLAKAPPPGGEVPSWDLTLNNIPIAYPNFTPTVIKMLPGSHQLWRVSNSAADSLVDLKVLYDGVPQTLKIVALDGVPTGSQDGKRQGRAINTDHVFLPTAGRAEFIVPAPGDHVQSALLVSEGVETGPAGDNDIHRILAKIKIDPGYHNNAADGVLPTLGITASSALAAQRFEGLVAAQVTAKRKLYFSEDISDPNNPLSPTNFFITVNGATPKIFDPTNGPAITTTQGGVEEWTIENRTNEHHEFHIHQVHFLVESQNNFEVNGTDPLASINGQFLDTVQVPYWDGNPKHPYPNVKVRLDFRGPDIGDFVYHCHILGHEDNGMMALIRVKPKIN